MVTVYDDSVSAKQTTKYIRLPKIDIEKTGFEERRHDIQ
jgi:hypothetical protein